MLTTTSYFEPGLGPGRGGVLLDTRETGPRVYQKNWDNEREQVLRALSMNIFGKDKDSDAAIMNLSLNGNISDEPQYVVGPFQEAPPLSSASIAAIVLGILGILANVSTLIAISRIRISLTANLRLIVSLCSSDMLVSASILLKLTHKQHQHQLVPIVAICMNHIFRAIRMTSHIVSLLNLVGLALDHYFAITKPLKYPVLMRKKHANLMIVSFWIFSALCGFSDFIIPSRYFSFCKTEAISNYCEAVHCSVYNEEYIMFTVAFISCALMIALYAIIFVQITRYQAFQQMFRQNMKRNRRGLITTFVIVATFMVTWLPYCLFDVIVIVSNRTQPQHYIYYFRLSRHLEWHFYNLLLLNSLLDPIIYAIRMREVQNGYRNFSPCSRLRRRHSSGVSMSLGEKRVCSRQGTMSVYMKQNQSESYV